MQEEGREGGEKRTIKAELKVELKARTLLYVEQTGRGEASQVQR